ncbi:uncharacterized protein si:dkeyp-117h8.4 [Triplophysa rosa]|uniref:Uncharacterized protein n=1 Tax=Triplophysa rosa TaxID=992332 RepID=A0A9W7WHB3_TRIRA|nr:uncharacterized protein si:dkeyp-117h8.4 [Triplophysa rosa]KAI7799591.1 hypothetical protein IRJ41_006747 [Triplophysa rosa]
MPGHRFHTDQFRKNDDVFRNTMESIFQKYSVLNDPGIDVCLKTMTCRTGRGSVPIESEEGERELENLKLQVKANHSIREDFENQENDQMELSGITEDNYPYSDQKENNESLCHGGDSLQQSMSVINSSHSSLLGVTFQPMKDDEELEKTLSSHGSTLLDVYPGMLSQIGEAYRRQHVTDTARAVLQKYRRKQWHAGVSNPRVTSLRNRTLIKTTEMSFTKQSSVQENLQNCIQDSGKLHNFKKLKPSPFKNASYEASACFYSPRRDNANVSGMSNESPRTELRLDRKPEQNTARVIDFSTTPHSVSPSLSDQFLDLNQTYDVELTVLSTDVPPSLVSTCPQPAWYSPGRTARALSLIEQRRMSLTTRPSDQQSSHTSLDKDCFRDGLHSPVSSPQRGFSCLSPSRMSIFKPVSMERQQSMAVHNSMRKSPAHCQVHSEVQRSPYGQKDKAMSSPQRSLYHRPEPQQSFSMAQKQTQISPRLSEHQRSLPGPKSACLSSRSHIDAEFRKLHHHFICHGTSSPCPSSGCHLCKNELKMTSQSMSALALTPLKIALKKRRRQPDVEESLRFKRFRESCSPVKHVQRLPHELKDEYVSPSIAEPGKDRHTWERAILLQCPSPQFLRGTGNLRRIRESKLAMQMDESASSWRDVSSGVHDIKAQSPLRSFNRGMTPLSASLSRRRLQYGLLQ